MNRKNFRKEGNYLAFNTPEAEPIFLILQELDNGFFYIMETQPFGPVQFVQRAFVDVPEDEQKEAGDDAKAETKSAK